MATQDDATHEGRMARLQTLLEDMDTMREQNDELGPILDREKVEVANELQLAKQADTLCQSELETNQLYADMVKYNRDQIHKLRDGGTFDVQAVRDEAKAMTQKKFDCLLHVIFGRLGGAHMPHFVKGISAEELGLLQDLFKSGMDGDLQLQIDALKREKTKTQAHNEERVTKLQEQVQQASRRRTEYSDMTNNLETKVDDLKAAVTMKNDELEALKTSQQALEAEVLTYKAHIQGLRTKTTLLEQQKTTHAKGEKDAKAEADTWREQAGTLRTAGDQDADKIRALSDSETRLQQELEEEKARVERRNSQVRDAVKKLENEKKLSKRQKSESTRESNSLREALATEQSTRNSLQEALAKEQNQNKRLRDENEQCKRARDRAIKAVETTSLESERAEGMQSALYETERERTASLETELQECKDKMAQAEKELLGESELVRMLRAKLETSDRDLEKEKRRTGTLSQKLTSKAEDVRSLQAAGASRQRDLDGVQDELKTRKGELKRANDRLSTARQELAAKQNALDAEQAATAEHKTASSKMTEELGQLRGDAFNQTSKIEGLEKSLAGEKTKCERLETAITEQTAECDSLHTANRSLRRTVARLRWRLSLTIICALGRGMTQRDACMAAMRDLRSHWQGVMAERDVRISNQAALQQGLTSDLNQQQARLEDMRQKAENLSRHTGWLQQEFAALRRKHGGVSGDLQRQEALVRRLQAENGQLKSERTYIRADKARLDVTSRRLQREVLDSAADGTKLRSQVQQLTRELRTTNAAHEDAARAGRGLLCVYGHRAELPLVEWLPLLQALGEPETDATNKMVERSWAVAMHESTGTVERLADALLRLHDTTYEAEPENGPELVALAGGITHILETTQKSPARAVLVAVERRLEALTHANLQDAGMAAHGLLFNLWQLTSSVCKRWPGDEADRLLERLTPAMTDLRGDLKLLLSWTASGERLLGFLRGEETDVDMDTEADMSQMLSARHVLYIIEQDTAVVVMPGAANEHVWLASLSQKMLRPIPKGQGKFEGTGMFALGGFIFTLNQSRWQWVMSHMWS